LNKLLNAQRENDPLIPQARAVRVSRKVQSDAQHREALRVRALIWRQQKLDDYVNIVEAIQIGALTCDVNAHLNYVTSTGIDAWNGDLEHVIDIIPTLTKPDIGHQWVQARQLGDVMAAEFCFFSCLLRSPPVTS